MILKEVEASYSELRSDRENFSNKVYGLSYRAIVSVGENSEDVRRHLLEKAIKDVKLLHGDRIDGRVEIKMKKVEEVPF